MVDPDAPNRQTQAFKWWRHWFLTDVPVSDYPVTLIVESALIQQTNYWTSHL